MACLWNPNLEKTQTEPNPYDSQLGTLSVGSKSNMVNGSSFRALSHLWRIHGSQIKRKDRQNLTLMNLNGELCQLGPIWLMSLSSEHCHTGGVFMVKEKTYRTNDSLCRTLPVRSNMVNDPSFRALSHWWRVYGSQIKKNKQTEPNPYDSQC